MAIYEKSELENDSELFGTPFEYEGTLQNYVDNVCKLIQGIPIHPKLSNCTKFYIFLPTPVAENDFQKFVILFYLPVFTKKCISKVVGIV